MLLHISHIRHLQKLFLLPLLQRAVIDFLAGVFYFRQQVGVLVRKVMMLLDVGPKLINECVPTLFVGHILKRCITQIIRVCTSLLYLGLPAQVMLHRVPHPFPHCDGEVTEFPVVTGEGFEFIQETGYKLLGEDTMFVGQNVFEYG